MPHYTLPFPFNCKSFCVAIIVISVSCFSQFNCVVCLFVFVSVCRFFHLILFRLFAVNNAVSSRKYFMHLSNDNDYKITHKKNLRMTYRSHFGIYKCRHLIPAVNFANECKEKGLTFYIDIGRHQITQDTMQINGDKNQKKDTHIYKIHHTTSLAP